VLRFDVVTARTKARVALAGEVADGAILCLLGRTGAGKSTALHMLSGREAAHGFVRLTDRTGTLREVGHLPTHARALAYVPQRPQALWPRRSVEATVDLVRHLRTRGVVPAMDVGPDRDTLIAALRLAAVRRQPSGRLSGGETQRLLVAAALASAPRGLLLDEPLSQQDPAQRAAFAEILADFVQRLGMFAVWATHDLREAERVAHTIVVLDRGQAVWRGTPEALTAHPPDRATAELVGYTAFLPPDEVRCAAGMHPPAGPARGAAVHPDRTAVGSAPPPSPGPWCSVSAVARSVRNEGARRVLVAETPGRYVVAATLPPWQEVPLPGTPVTLWLHDPPWISDPDGVQDVPPTPHASPKGGMADA